MISWDRPGIISSARLVYPWLIWLNVTFISLITGVIAVAPNVAATAIRGDLCLSSDEMLWVSIGFIMMLGLVLPLGIWLAEKYGYKKLFFIGTVIFILGLIAASQAKSFIPFLAGRMIEGIGGGFIFPMSTALLVKVFPKKTLSIALALYIGFGFGLGAGLGYFMGGFCTQNWGWQSIFIVSAFFSLPSLVLTWLLHEETEKKPEETFDHLGFLYFTLFFGALLVVVNSGKARWNTEGWTSPFIITFSAVGLIGLILLLYRELKCPKPLVLFSLFKSESFLLGSISVAFTAIIVYVTMTLAPVFTIVYLNYEFYQGGLFLVPIGFSIACGSILAAWLIKTVGVRWLTIIGMTLLAIGCYFSSGMTIYSSHAQIQWLFNIRAFGVGLALGPATAFALSEIPKNLAGPASILVTLFRQMGGTLGTAAAETIIIQRTPYHNDIFGTRIDPAAPRFQEVIEGLQSRLVDQVGVEPELALEQAAALIRKNAITQAKMASFNDAFFLIGMIIAAITFFLLVELLWSYRKRRA